ncbi:PREDICTED: zinc finger protein ZAT5-like [Ipomoea nil]|uniref:zinc finger protein ZAT5-like n=1 Tax=Ipomoea nil TaxID=35883 RepID=UPI0009009070|nr:PREDICTED: zinc finger protein ZAT5-like [Ipomoea nil]
MSKVMSSCNLFCSALITCIATKLLSPYTVSETCFFFLSALPFYYLFIIISATAFAKTTRKMKAEFQDFSNQMFLCKGRRTKRPRASPPVGVAVDSCPSGDGGGGCYLSLVHSPESSCSQMSMATQEDENMAHCLILLARSGCPKQDAGNDVKAERISCQKSSDTVTSTAAATTTTSVYECKTCNRKFRSFQALGGHRASHSKPKLIPEDHKKSTPLDHHHHHQEIQDKTHEKSNKTKIHECLICGSLFFSGQALGGHMRRHRPLHINTTITMKAPMDDDDQEKPKPVFTLDLNLPAPDDDEADDEDTTMFEFSDKQQSSAFSTSAMVDCHY